MSRTFSLDVGAIVIFRFANFLLTCLSATAQARRAGPTMIRPPPPKA